MYYDRWKSITFEQWCRIDGPDHLDKQHGGNSCIACYEAFIERPERLAPWLTDSLYAIALQEPYRESAPPAMTRKFGRIMCCLECGEFNEYAEPNLPDGMFRCSRHGR